MAATVDYRKTLQTVPSLIRELQLSSLVNGGLENLAHGGPDKTKPTEVRFEVVTPPTSGDALVCYHDSANDSLANSTVGCRFTTEAGGDSTGAVVRARFVFANQGPRDGSSIGKSLTDS